MHEEIKTNSQSRNARQNPWAAWPRRAGGHGICAGAVHRFHPRNAGFLFRLAMLQRNNATTRRICGPRIVIEPPQFHVAFA
jgi:hypothetical protein